MNSYKLVSAECGSRQCRGNCEHGKCRCRRSKTDPSLSRTPRQQSYSIHVNATLSSLQKPHKSSKCAVETLQDPEIADETVLLDLDSTAMRHVTSLTKWFNSVLASTFRSQCHVYLLWTRDEECWKPVNKDNVRYLGSMAASSLDDIKRRRGIAWSNFWKLEHIWRSQTVNITTKLRPFDSLVISVFLYTVTPGLLC